MNSQFNLIATQLLQTKKTFCTKKGQLSYVDEPWNRSSPLMSRGRFFSGISGVTLLQADNASPETFLGARTFGADLYSTIVIYAELLLASVKRFDLATTSWQRPLKIPNTIKWVSVYQGSSMLRARGSGPKFTWITTILYCCFLQRAARALVILIPQDLRDKVANPST